MKVPINICYGGFSLSPEGVWWLYDAQSELIELSAVDEYYRNHPDDSLIGYKNSLARWEAYRDGIKRERSVFNSVFTDDGKFIIHVNERDKKNRTHPDLIACIETLGDLANGACAEIKIVEIPDGTDFEISEYDGREHIAETHRTWT